jgi:hypothetical protein
MRETLKALEFLRMRGGLFDHTGLLLLVYASVFVLALFSVLVEDLAHLTVTVNKIKLYQTFFY